MTRLYPSMAFTNIKKSRRTYIPYMVSCILTISIYYIICSLADNENIALLWGGNIIQSYMGFGQIIVSIFAFIFLFYINSFLLKRRRSEFGLYNILGMEKRHITKVIIFETFYTYITVMILGILCGILLDKLMYLILAKMFGGGIPIGFYISTSAISKSFGLFGIIFLLILFNSIRQIYKAKPVELLKSESTGEREPKVKWILAALGVACLGSGYYIAVTTENPVAAFAMYFVAVILVIAGTYLLFTAGSVELLKLLKKNKGYYYKTKHFISVSSMMYRMKRNAVGLANICILSTMVLVMVSATLSIYLGLDDSLDKRYPAEFSISSMADDPLNNDVSELLDKSLSKEGLKKKNEISYKDLSVSAVYEEKEDRFITDPDSYTSLSAFQTYDKLATLVFVTLDDYNRCMRTDETINSESDVLVYSNRAQLETDTINIFNTKLNVIKTLDDFMVSGNMAANISNGYFVVVKDDTVLNDIYKKNVKAYGEYSSFINYYYLTDIAGDPEENKTAIENAFNDIKTQLNDSQQSGDSPYAGFTGAIECRSVEGESFGKDLTGLFFIGIFLGLLFIMATVLIMYYKQLTEGYEDKKRFEILQNVGMSHREVKKSINSQILTVFFLPLITAGIHVAFNFPFIFRVLTLLNLFNMKLFALCTIGCFLVFTIFYIIVYKMTSRLYYRIVKK